MHTRRNLLHRDYGGFLPLGLPHTSFTYATKDSLFHLHIYILFLYEAVTLGK